MCQDKLSRTCLRLVPMHILEAIVEKAEDIQCSDLSGGLSFSRKKDSLHGRDLAPLQQV